MKPRNPLIATACFKAGYIDAWGRGIEKMTNACAAAGLPAPTFEANSGGVLATFTQQPNARAESGAESGAESQVIKALAENPRSKSEIAHALGKEKPTGHLNNMIRRLLTEGLIEYTIPGKPNSRLQKYRLTEKGRKVLEKPTKE